MSFDSHSLERLRELGRKLPKPLPETNNISKSSKKTKSNLHPIETEEKPEKLFEELIKASPDGEIPPHLIERLKEVESLEHKKSITTKIDTSSKQKQESKPNYKKDFKAIEQKDDLYIPFKQLLLEEYNDV